MGTISTQPAIGTVDALEKFLELNKDREILPSRLMDFLIGHIEARHSFSNELTPPKIADAIFRSDNIARAQVRKAFRATDAVLAGELNPQVRRQYHELKVELGNIIQGAFLPG